MKLYYAWLTYRSSRVKLLRTSAAAQVIQTKTVVINTGFYFPSSANEFVYCKVFKGCRLKYLVGTNGHYLKLMEVFQCLRIIITWLPFLVSLMCFVEICLILRFNPTKWYHLSWFKYIWSWIAGRHSRPTLKKRLRKFGSFYSRRFFSLGKIWNKALIFKQKLKFLIHF